MTTSRHHRQEQQPAAPITVTVRYWLGTTQVSGTARTYRGAMRLAGRNRNAYGPQFYDQDGRELADDGNGLAYVDRLEQDGTTVYAI